MLQQPSCYGNVDILYGVLGDDLFSHLGMRMCRAQPYLVDKSAFEQK